MSYWDTSCLIKLYTPEPDSRIFRDFLDVGAACVTCDITPLEFWATVRRKESEGVLAPGEARKIQRALETDLVDGLIQMTSCDSAVRSRFDEIVELCHSLVPPIFIRTNMPYTLLPLIVPVKLKSKRRTSACAKRPLLSVMCYSRLRNPRYRQLRVFLPRSRPDPNRALPRPEERNS